MTIILISVNVLFICAAYFLLKNIYTEKELYRKNYYEVMDILIRSGKGE